MTFVLKSHVGIRGFENCFEVGIVDGSFLINEDVVFVLKSQVLNPTFLA